MLFLVGLALVNYYMNDMDENNLLSMVQDNSGGISSIRVLMLIWGIGCFVVWMVACVLSLIHGIYVLPTLPPEIVSILIGITTMKAIQRGLEK